MRSAPSVTLIDEPNTTESLLFLTVEELKWYARLVPGKAPIRKGELVTFLLKTLTNSEQVRSLWNQLDAQQQLVVAEAIHQHQGRYVGDIMAAKYPGVGAPRHPNAYDFGGFGNLFGRPAKKDPTPYDLLFCGSDGSTRVIPQDLRELLHPFVAPPPPMEMPGHDDPPAFVATQPDIEAPEVTVSDTERVAFHDLAATLYLIQQGKLSVSATTKLPTLPAVRLLRQRLLHDDYFAEEQYARADDAIRPLALIMIVQAAKWATLIGTGGKLELTKRGQALLATPISAEHVREAWDRWVKSDLLDELQRIKAIKGQQSKQTRLTKPSERREKLAATLRALPAERWVLLRDFFRYMRAERLAPEIERGLHTTLYLGSSMEYGWLGDSEYDYWDTVVGSYLRAVLWEYAATLGLIDIAYVDPEDLPLEIDDDDFYVDDIDVISRYDGLLGLRITSLGRYVFGLTTEYVPQADAGAQGPPVLKVLPTLDLVVTDSARIMLNERAFLERIGTAQSQDVYRLSRELVLEALEFGLTADQILEFLSTKSGVAVDDLPQTVRVFFTDLRQRLNAIRDGGKMLILEGDDLIVMTELARSSELRGIVRLATVDGAPVLLVPEAREAAVRKQLRKLGYIAAKK